MPTIASRNWCGHVPFRAARVHHPRRVEEIADIVRGASRVKVIGARHCFNDIADTDGDLLWLGELDHDIVVDGTARTVQVGAGVTYGELAPVLHGAGFALANLASLHHISVVGAVTTATHGSGDRLGNLATAVAAVELIDGNGEWRVLSRRDDPQRFPGAVVSLGALGVITRLTLDVEPTYDVEQHLYESVPFEAIFADFDAVSAAGDSVSLFPTWQSELCDRVWVKRRAGADGLVDPFPLELAGGRRMTAEQAGPLLPDRRRTVLGVPGPWHERLPHLVLLDPLAVGEELQSEYFVAREHAVAAMRAVAALREELQPILWVSEVRTVAADDLWLSTAYGADTVALHFNWLPDAAGVEAFLPVLEAALEPFAPRPHWGKLFALDGPTVRSRYPKLGDFSLLRDQLDPQRRFANRYLDRMLGT